MAGPKASLIKGLFKEVLRTLKEDSAYLTQGTTDQLQATTSAAAAWGVQCTTPDAHRALSRVRAALIAGGDVRAMWAASKQRAKQRLRDAVAAVERRYEAAVGSSGAQQQQEEVQEGHAAAAAPHAGPMHGDAAHGELSHAFEQVDPELQALYGTDGPARAAVMFTLAHLGRTWMTVLNQTDVEGAEHLAAALEREPGRALITVSNHVASIDDPFVTAAVLPPSAFGAPERLRWTLCASDRCFHRAALVPFFRAAKVLPVERGAGMFQPGLAAAEARLRAGDWVHIFPEGTRSRDGARIGPARKGVGRLVAACARPEGEESGGGGGAAPLPPLVVPFVHSGMQEVMPRGALVPRAGKTVRVLVGEPVPVSDLLEAAASDGWPDDRLYRAIAARVGLAMQVLKARLDGAPLDLAALEAEQAGAAGLDLYDPRDRHANADVGWRTRGAARWVQSLRDRVDFKALHRDWAVRGVAASALARIAGSGTSGSGAAAASAGGPPVAALLPPMAAAAASGGGAAWSSGGGSSFSSGGGQSVWSAWAAATALHGFAA